MPSGELKDCRISKANKFITKKGLESSAAKMMPVGTVLIALTGATTGQIGLLTIESTANQSVTGILPSKKHIPEYLFYYLQTIRKKVLNLSYGGAQKHISQGFVKNISVPLPPLETQKKIVALLVRAEKVKEIRNKVDKLTNDLLMSTFYEMFYNKGFDEVELGDEKICVLPGEYGSGASAVEYDKTKPRYVRITDINENGDLRDEIVSPSKVEKKYLLQKGDLLFARSGATVGKTIYIMQLGNFNTQVI